jgi:hypothetical protein
LKKPIQASPFARISLEASGTFSGPPLEAVMNPVYTDVNHTLRPLDNAVLCEVWMRWPN